MSDYSSDNEDRSRGSARIEDSHSSVPFEKHSSSDSEDSDRTIQDVIQDIGDTEEKLRNLDDVKRFVNMVEGLQKALDGQNYVVQELTNMVADLRKKRRGDLKSIMLIEQQVIDLSENYITLSKSQIENNDFISKCFNIAQTTHEQFAKLYGSVKELQERE